MVRKWFLSGFVVVAVGYFGISSHISNSAEEYIKETITSSLSFDDPEATKFILKSYLPDRKIAVVSLKDIYSKKSKDTNISVEEGPLFSSKALIGLIKIEKRGDIKEFILEDELPFEKNLQRPIEVEYSAILDFMHVIHEDIHISKVELKDESKYLYISPVKAVSSYTSKTQKGLSRISCRRLIVKNLDGSQKIDVHSPKIELKSDGVIKDEPLYGSYKMEAKEVALYEKSKIPLRVNPHFEISLKRVSNSWVDFDLGFDIKAVNSATSKAWSDIESFDGEIKLQKLGLEGIKELIRVAKEQDRARRELVEAMEAKNDVAMQRSIVKIESLRHSWIDIYNKTLLKGQTRFEIKKVIHREKENHIFVDLLFQGDKLDSNELGALANLSANFKTLFDGEFDILLEREFLEKFYEDGAILFDAMVKKGLATFENGEYHFKGRVEDGIITIDGKKYTFEEFMLKVFM